jgi:hypothetical protein
VFVTAIYHEARAPSRIVAPAAMWERFEGAPKSPSVRGHQYRWLPEQRVKLGSLVALSEKGQPFDHREEHRPGGTCGRLVSGRLESRVGFEPTTPGSKVRDPSAELAIEAR